MGAIERGPRVAVGAPRARVGRPTRGWPVEKLEVFRAASTGLLEGTNSAARRKARGYRNLQRMITTIYLIGNRLPRPATHLP